METNKSVLICEDNMTSATTVKLILKKIGYFADIAQDAKTAEKFLKEKQYGFMILDIILPDKNGLDLLNEIRENEQTKDLPVIILSATDKKQIDENMNKKITYWLEKAFDCSTLENIVNSIIQNEKLNKAKIFHLEDDADLANIIAIALEEIADIKSVNNLKEAETILKQEQFDLIILDYKLAGGTCEKLVDNLALTPNKNAKLILFSAFEPSKELAKKFNQIILKTTVSHEQFLSCVKTCIKK